MTEGKVLTASQVLALSENHKNGDERPSTEVVRPLDQENDLGNLLASEVNEFQLSAENLEDELKARARDNCQLLLNELWTLPTGSFSSFSFIYVLTVIILFFVDSITYFDDLYCKKCLKNISIKGTLNSTHFLDSKT